MMKRNHSSTLIAFICMCLLTGCVATQSPSLPRDNSEHRPEDYYAYGVDDAWSQYYAVGPFFTGLTTGVVLPVSTAAATVATEDAKIGLLTGIAGFGLTLWGDIK